MMKEMQKVFLDFDKTYPYFIHHIEYKNLLFEKILQGIDFRKGVFFTLLPACARFDKKYDFSSSILPLGEKVEHSPFENTWRIQTTNNEICEFISKYLNSGKEKLGVFDYAIAKPNDPHLEIQGADLSFYNEQVYYILRNSSELDSILEVVTAIKEVWHFLGVLTDFKIDKGSKIEEFAFDKACEKTEYIIAGAYDGEGYIIWERQEPM